MAALVAELALRISIFSADIEPLQPHWLIWTRATTALYSRRRRALRIAALGGEQAAIAKATEKSLASAKRPAPRVQPPSPESLQVSRMAEGHEDERTRFKSLM